MGIRDVMTMHVRWSLGKSTARYKINCRRAMRERRAPAHITQAPKEHCVFTGKHKNIAFWVFKKAQV